MYRILTILILTLLSVCTSNAQYSETPPPCLPRYSAPTYEFAHQTVSPPLYPSTPIDVILGYLALDSVCHLATRLQARNFIENLTYDDTLKTIMKYWYKVVDNNPLDYLSYTSNIDSTFRNLPGHITGMLNKTIYSVSPHKIEDLFLCQSTHIYKGVVIDSIVKVDSMGGDMQNVSMLYTFVIDTLKGQHFPTHMYQMIGNVGNSKNDVQVQATRPPQPCFAIDFRPALAYRAAERFGLDTITALPPKVGDTCYFFVKPVYVAFCSNSSYISFVPNEGTKSRGVYRVVNGFVSCPDLEFTGELYVTESRFKDAVLEHIARITSE